MTLRGLAVPIAAALMTACGPSLQYHREPGVTIPAGATWAWSLPDRDGLAVEAGAIVPPDSIARTIESAIETELSLRGFRRVHPDSAQFFVHFHAGRRTVIDTLPWHDDPASSARGSRPGGGWGTYGRPEELTDRTVTWDEGMLIVDVVTKDGRLVAWRGAIAGEIPAKAERDAAPAIRESIRVLLRRFP